MLAIPGKRAAFVLCVGSAIVLPAAHAQTVDLQRACRDQYGADYQAQLQAPGGAADWRCVRKSASSSAGGIQVIAGTYGMNCRQPRGNKTAHLAAACSGRNQCDYVVDVTAIGDPAYGCSKDYVAEWQCPGSSETQRATAGAEAGYRSKISLSCSAQAAAGGDALDTLLIPNDRPLKVQSNIVLERGRWYVLEASGVVTDWSHVKDGVDAVWCYADWRCGKGEAWNQLRVDDKGLSDIAGSTLPYNPQHVYRVRVQGQGKPIVAHSSDAQASWSDNAGAFTLKIYPDGAAPVAAPGRSYTSRPRASEAIQSPPVQTGRSYTSRPRATHAVPAQPATTKTEEAVKKAVEGALKGLFNR